MKRTYNSLGPFDIEQAIIDKKIHFNKNLKIVEAVHSMGLYSGQVNRDN
jgi:hypothetical protein